MPSIVIAAPVLPGKTNVGREFGKAVMGEKRKEMTESRSSIGEVRETVCLYRTPLGDSIAVLIEASDPVWANKQFAASKTPFDTWFKTKAKEVTGVDYNQPLPPLEHLFEARIGTPSNNLIAWAAPILPGKTPAARALFKDLSTTRAKDYLASMVRAGKTHESVWLMPSPMGEFATGYTEGPNLQKSMDYVSTSKDAYDGWYRSRMLEIFGLDMAKDPFPMPEIIIDWQWR